MMKEAGGEVRFVEKEELKVEFEKFNRSGGRHEVAVTS